MPNASVARLASILLAATLVSCSDFGPVAMGQEVLGVWRGSNWGLDASRAQVLLYDHCFATPVTTRPLRWDANLRFDAVTGTPDAPTWVLIGHARRDGSIILAVNIGEWEIDTLHRAARADFANVVACD